MSSASAPAGSETAASPAAAPGAGDSQVANANQPAPAPFGAKTSGFGMPCAKCNTYYAVSLKVCPVCKTTERVSPSVVPVLAVAPAADPVSEETPELAVLEAERERFLREFKAQLATAQLQAPASASTCSQTENHQAGAEPAIICQHCYDQLHERIDVMEAALHMDIKEAAQIVYDAVWADTSDSGKTYENAAQCLLGELRKRAGVTQTFGLMKPVTD